MKTVVRALGRVIAANPTSIGAAVRATLVLVLGVGFHVDEVVLAASYAVVEAWLAVVQAALVTPEVKVRAREKRKADEVVAYLSSLDDAA